MAIKPLAQWSRQELDFIIDVYKEAKPDIEINKEVVMEAQAIRRRQILLAKAKPNNPATKRLSILKLESMLRDSPPIPAMKKSNWRSIETATDDTKFKVLQRKARPFTSSSKPPPRAVSARLLMPTAAHRGTSEERPETARVSDAPRSYRSSRL